MSVKLLTEHHFEFQSLKEAALARLSQHKSKCHCDIVENPMSRLNYNSELKKIFTTQYVTFKSILSIVIAL